MITANASAYLADLTILNTSVITICVISIVYFCYLLEITIYNLYFHPLSRFPGPKTFAASPIPYVKWQLSGRLPYMYKHLHDQYGDIVRVLPNELSFSTPSAWREIYCSRPGHPILTKDPKSFHPSSEGAYNIVTASSVTDHARYRRFLNPAFSERAIREQELEITHHVSLLMRKIREQGLKEPQDLVRWFNLAMFDIIADLTFGESLDGLTKLQFHPWLAGLLGSAIKVASLRRAMGKFPHIEWLLNYFIPKSLVEQRVKHESFSKEMVERALTNNTEKRSIVNYLMPANVDERPLSIQEIRATCGVMMLAGSENLVATLAITVYHLLKQPAVLRKLKNELRDHFNTEEAIMFTSTSSLKYLCAVLNETMRIQPAAPTSQPRLIPKDGETICGYRVPGGTLVSVPPLCMNHSAHNFEEPDAFLPERWLEHSNFASDAKSAFQPFGVGQRNCIGKSLALAELRLVLARLLWNFDLALPEESSTWAEDLKVYHLWELTPFYVELTPVVRDEVQAGISSR